MKQTIKPIDGVLHLIAYDQQGRELWSMRQSNQIVNGAYEIAAEALAGMAGRAATSLGITTVGLSGGVMQNAIMARLLPQALDHMGLKALTHHELPPGDGGLSLGQAVWGRRMLAAGAGQ